jgi:hypothetical protein
MKPFLLIMVVVVASSSGQSPTLARPCILVAGAGCGNLIVDKTKRADFLPDLETEKRFASEGLTFSFRAGDVLDTIVATGKEFKTNSGVGPGDTEKHVRQVYGKPTITKATLRKGELEIGTVGERVLVYPGIRFVISKERVWAVVIVPQSE